MWWLLFVLPCVSAHGFLCNPPSRNAAWMCGFPNDTPKNYDQMALNAGGVRTTYPNYPEPHPLVYGVCGDPFNAPQIHAAGGVHDRGVRSVYTRGQELALQVNITAWHNGSFEFQLCPTYPESETCFTTFFTYDIAHTATEGGNPTYFLETKLPQNFTCHNRCVLRWFWTTNNSPGLPHEIFLNCADIRVV